MKNRSLFAAAVVLALAGHASADQIIYQDLFSNGSPGSPAGLNGNQPTTDNGGFGGTANAPWDADSQWVTNGSVATAFTQTANAYLPFTPQAGFVYTLSASLGNTSDQWAALGFTQYAAASTPFWSPDAFPNTNEPNAGPFVSEGIGLLERGRFVSGPGYVNLSGTGTGTQEGTYVITLDTTQTFWTYTVSGPGLTTGPVTFGANPTINFVGFGSWSPDSVETSTVDHFTLTVVTTNTPEPSSYLLLGLGKLDAICGGPSL